MGIGKKFGVFVTNKGKLWVCGQNFQQLVVGDKKNWKPLNVPMPAGLTAVKVWTPQVPTEQEVAIVMCKNETGESQLWSFGTSNEGLLGQGTKVKESKQLGKLDYDSSKTTFVDVSIYNNHAMAIDQDGNLWSWGSNSFCKAGHHEGFQQSFKPMKTDCLDEHNVKAIKVSAGLNHSLVLAEDS